MLSALAGGLAILALGVLAAPAFAGNTPIAPARPELKPLAQVDTWVSPSVDVPGLLREDKARAGKDAPLRIGYPMKVDLGTATSGTWEDLKGGGQVWRFVARSEKALWIVFGFDSFRIPAGAELRIYEPTLKTVQTYTAADVRDHGQLWTPPIAGDELVAELYMPEKLRGVDPGLHIGTISHGYKPFGTIGRDKVEKAIGDSGSCNIDINCPLGAAWQNEKRGVVILLSGGADFCSGSLINTTANDCRPYVLTAHHCSANATTSYGFNFERSGCGTGDPPPATTYTVAGGPVLGDYASSDFTLLQMNAQPPESYNVYYNGWNRSPLPSQQSWNISHPSGDVKKIAHDADPPTDGSNWGPNHWRIGQYEEGTTEPGSSGSPLFDQNHYITGQLHGGTASCTSLTYDEYGKLSESWVGGGTAATRLSDWLDPNVSGQETMPGVNAATCAFHPAGELSLDRSKYACTDTLTITLRDDNLRGNPTQTVTVTSNTETTPETVTLTAIEDGSGTFRGTFPIGAPPAVTGDGTLSVVNGDTVTVLYIDADDGAGGVNVPVTTAAAVDCSGPVISGVNTQNITGNSAQVLWTTDELSNSRVIYDTAFPPSASTASNAAVVVNHQVGLAGLNPCTTYYYYVSSTDTAGNVSSDTNNGAYYTFRTGTNTNPTYTYPGPAVPIPDNNAAGVTAVINVPYYEFIQKVTVTVNVTHTFDGDVSLSLIAPDGVTTVPLVTRRGSSGDNFIGTVFDDAATTAISAGTAPFTGSFRPESPLSVLNGTPSYGNWTLKAVDSAGSDTGTIDSWSITFQFPPAPCGAQVILDKDIYGCSTTAHVTVKDTNVAGATLNVVAASNTEPGGQVVTLTRQPAPKDTWFEGDVVLTGAAPNGGDGLLSVVNADLVTVTYIDADDGQGNTNVNVTDTATTDCAGPVISNVSSSNIQGTTATIDWTTNKPADSLVRYGLAVPPTLTSSSAAFVTTHAQALTGLNPCSTYYYQVESRDAYGNVSIDNNGGTYYLFTTPQNTAATYTSTDGPIAIPDNNAAGAISTINVADPDQILDLNVTVNITHTFDGDLQIFLIAPNGTQISLSNRRGSSGDNFTNTVFDDQATTAISAGTAPFTGSFKPETPLSAINGLAAAGAWQLKVVDNANSDTGSIQNWSLSFTYQPRTCGPSAKYLSNTFTDVCSVGGTGGGNGAIEQGEDITMPVTIRNDGAVNLTNITGVITTSTPGVYVTGGTAAFPDVASGLSVTSNAPHFQYTVGQTVPCGSDIAFNLAIVTAQGTFNSSFSVKVGKVGSAVNSYPATDVPKPVPDNNATGVSSVTTITDTNPVTKVRVTVNITHTWDNDLSIFLIGPNGTSVTLSARHGSSGDNYTSTVFDDAATTPIASGTPPYTGTYKPDTPLSALNGIAANGAWTLKVTDSASSDTGTLTGWTLELTTSAGYQCINCAVSAPAVEVLDQAWSPDKSTHSWSPVAGAVAYNVYRGAGGDLPNLVTPAVDSCLRLTTGATSTTALTEHPAAGGLYWYLVRAINGGGEGPAGNATSGPRVHDSSGSCP